MASSLSGVCLNLFSLPICFDPRKQVVVQKNAEDAFGERSLATRNTKASGEVWGGGKRVLICTCPPGRSGAPSGPRETERRG